LWGKNEEAFLKISKEEDSLPRAPKRLKPLSRDETSQNVPNNGTGNIRHSRRQDPWPDPAEAHFH
jgi:hypothetical protein